MTSRTAHPWHITREEADCIEFDAEFDAYLKGGEVGALLRASYKVAGSAIEMDPKRAFTLAELTGARQATRGLRRCGARDPALVRSDAGAGREALKAIRLRARTNALPRSASSSQTRPMSTALARICMPTRADTLDIMARFNVVRERLRRAAQTWPPAPPLRRLGQRFGERRDLDEDPVKERHQWQNSSSARTRTEPRSWSTSIK
jgi:hypothetical protein